jgi:hypothetical protein
MATEEAQKSSEKMAVIRSVRHKSTAAALLSLGCHLHGIVRAEDGWFDVEIEVPPDCQEDAQKVTGGGDVMIEWGRFRDALRFVSTTIKEHNKGAASDE